VGDHTCACDQNMRADTLKGAALQIASRPVCVAGEGPDGGGGGLCVRAVVCAALSVAAAAREHSRVHDRWVVVCAVISGAPIPPQTHPRPPEASPHVQAPATLDAHHRLRRTPTASGVMNALTCACMADGGGVRSDRLRVCAADRGRGGFIKQCVGQSAS
jgi:hypothetical protein